MAELTRSDSLADWLRHLETLHPRAIDLGLERVREVWERLGSPRPAPVCITIGGTNGKGSTVAFLEAMLRAAGHRVGAYTSPHLLRYNERVRLDGVDAADADLVSAFADIEAARGEVSLSYFEFGTLAAFLLLERSGVDAAILEVGLGGRLDAVNLIDADAAVLTSVDLDHQEYLGETRERIGWDKAHIFRAGRPAIVAAVDPPASVFAVAHALGAVVLRPPEPLPGQGEWRCALPDGTLLGLPPPALVAPCQRRNAQAALWAWHALRARLRFDAAAAARGVALAQVRGRLQRLPRTPETWVDVAHNPEAARVLAGWLAADPRRRKVAVFAALADKDLAGIVAPLRQHFHAWVVLDLRPASPRAADPAAQARALAALLAGDPCIETAADIAAALAQAERLAGPAGRVVVFGSFFTVAAALSM
ncbi:MAG: bifunctional tetrahydrofolate synthase/dihydrofolate synthase [Xanthomonadales bacterium]|nr:Dihydrofolate synthase/folylpolyglutamate synthase [Xanthomonadales bacterium]MCC6591637.1 bifunctional tetrahydrofolate synthase/dihydrofolate synthase [Xanthomonadales bacterium]MCE7930073.1 bifunctional tetrahydrofolate synthase/dihydrofolate synthase [Xanthomonadales bacterium PRO6]